MVDRIESLKCSFIWLASISFKSNQVGRETEFRRNFYTGEKVRKKILDTVAGFFNYSLELSLAMLLPLPCCFPIAIPTCVSILTNIYSCFRGIAPSLIF